MNRFYCRPRPRRRRKFLWQGWVTECSFYAIVSILVLQGVRLLIRPTPIDGVIFIAAILALLPSVM